MIKWLKKRWTDLPFRRQILMIYGLSLVAMIGAGLGIYFGVVRSYVEMELETQLNAEWRKVETQLNKVLEKTGEYSKIISANHEIQEYLKEPSNEIKENEIESSGSYVMTIMKNSDIESIYIYDLAGNYHVLGTQNLPTPIKRSVTEANWYSTVYAKNGSDSVFFEGGDFFEQQDDGFLSVITLVKDTTDATPLGVLICNVSLEKILRPIRSKMVLCRIMDGLGEMFYCSREEYDLTKLTDYVRIYGPTALRVHVAIDTSSVEAGYLIYYRAIILLLFFTAAIILLSTQILHWSINRPLRYVVAAMEERRLETLNILETNRDMTNLQIGYNHMTEQINQLLVQVKNEQKEKRQYELRVLNAQIRPHFLYNTFDSVCALALMGQSKDIYRLMQALGKYYRISLHKGEESIRLREELDIIKNYVIIQKYRFDDIFDVQYEVDEALMEEPVLKLILQPFVENSIYHGLKSKGGGKIVISAWKEQNDLFLRIMDTGKGMTQDKIKKILNGEVDGEEKSFGVHGTVERIALHYGQENLVKIDSKIDEFTTITIKIPGKVKQEVLC